MSRIHFVGGEKGGVGKSVLSRLLAQYCIDRELPFRAYDADASHGAMLRYYADFSEPVDISRFESIDNVVEQTLGRFTACRWLAGVRLSRESGSDPRDRFLPCLLACHG
ncbi:MAG: hypothetical protein P8Z31_03630 [Gammaproteobacteria bacterium]